MKFLIAFYIALGLVLSLLIVVEYNCTGDDMSPKYWGSPLVFTKSSLASSMEFYYGFFPLFLNTLIWSIVLLVINSLIEKFTIKVKGFRVIKWFRILIIGFLLFFSTINILISYELSGRNFGKGFNYWTIDMEESVKVWKMKCEGEIKILK